MPEKDHILYVSGALLPKYRLTVEETSKILNIHHAGEVDFAYMHRHTESPFVYHLCLFTAVN